MIPLAEIKTWLGVTTSIYDEALMQAESDAVATANRLIGYYFGLPEEATYIVPGNDTRKLYLSDHPAYTPEEDPYGSWEILQRSYEGDENEEEILAEDDDGWRLRGHVLYRKGGYTWSCAYEFVITYERGYPEGEEPGDVRRLVLALLSVWWNRRGIEGGLTSETIGGYSYTLSDMGDALLLSDPTIAAIVGARRRQRA